MIIQLFYESQPFDEAPACYFEHLKGDYACFLESGKGGRYSYIAYDPFMIVWLQNGVMQTLSLKDFFDVKKSLSKQIIGEDDKWAVTDLLGKYELKMDSPVPFCGGAAGYLSYDYGCNFVGVEQKVFDDIHIPDYMFGFYDKVIAFDHDKSEIYFIALAETDLGAKRKVEEIKNDLNKPKSLNRKGLIGQIESNINQAVYTEKINKIKNLLRKGETYQVNFSQRFSGDCSLDPLLVYKKLAQENPSPFACFFDYPNFCIVSSSPELLIRKRGKKLETWPIKGTVPRGRFEKEDEANIKELLSSKKDDAELSMITDLSRNDLGKVCEIGSVKVDAHREIQKYSHVIHTVSRVSGTLLEKKDIFDCLKAIFPGGSITGCPKKRTMEIIDQLEDYKRGIYTGSAGFIGFNGDADFNILIRTMLFKDNRVYFHSGGGIVIDSDPEKEYKETLDKVEALRLVL
jgi:para-aminobenzoate synthetase component 1